MIKYAAKGLICKTETDSWTYRTDLWLSRGVGRRGDGLKIWGYADANYYI